MGRNNPIIKPAFTCTGCGRTLQHNKEIKDSLIVRGGEGGSELIALYIECKIKCRTPGCKKETIIAGEIPVK